MNPETEDPGVEPDEQIAAPESALDPGLYEDVFEGSSEPDGMTFSVIETDETVERDD
jgi:hypothetical protein